jgi:hypothetical protein
MARTRKNDPLADSTLRGSAAQRLDNFLSTTYGADPNSTDFEVKAKQIGVAMQKQRNAGWVSDVGAMSQILDRVVKMITDEGRRKGTTTDPTNTFNMYLVNDAYTILQDGTAFRYFDAVDRGRSTVYAKRARKLAYIVVPYDNDRSGNVTRGEPQRLVSTIGVKGTKPAYISTKAQTELFTEIPKRVQKQFEEFARTITGPFNENVTTQLGQNRKFTYQNEGKSDLWINDLGIQGTVTRAAEADDRKRSGYRERQRAKANKRAGVTPDFLGGKRHKKPKKAKPAPAAAAQQQAVRLVKKSDKISDKSQSASKKIEEDIKKNVVGGTTTGRFDFKPHFFRAVPQITVDVAKTPEIDESYFEQSRQRRVALTMEFLDDALAEEGLSRFELTRSQIIEFVERDADKFVKDLRAEMAKQAADQRSLRQRFADAAQAGGAASSQLFGIFNNITALDAPGQLDVRDLDIFDYESGKDRRATPKDFARQRKDINAARAAILLGLTQFTNAAEVIRYFMKSVTPAIAIYKKHTPRRKGYKLLSNGQYLKPSKSNEQDFLRNRYKFVTTGELSDFIESYGKK